ncbi:MAG: hypothetical protein IH600_08575 [Bacteroidetes bacterium]|nr:hypothetical protein [Bacteroidota bacterium]
MRPLFVILISFLSLTACKSGDQQQTETDAAADSAALAIGNATYTTEDRGPSITLDAPVMLFYRMKPGDSFGYMIRNTEDVTVTQDTIDNINHQILSWWYRFEVLEVKPEGGARLRTTCDRVRFSGTYDGPGGKQKVTYDSQEKNSYDVEKRFAQYNAPVNTPFVIVIDKDGRISDVTELSEVIKNFLKDDYRTTKSNQMEGIARDYAETGLKSVLQLAFQKLAETPVGKDSSWTIVRPDRIGYMAVRNTAVYTVRDVVKSPSGKVAHIDAAINSMYVGDKKMDTGQGMATMNEFDVKGVGSTVFNLDHGRVQRRRLRTDVKVKMWVEPPEELKQLAPDQAHDFWYSQKASVENVIEPYQRP